MAEPQDLRATGDRIELLVDQLHAQGDRASCERAEELLRLVTELYGGALLRIVTLAHEQSPQLVDALVADELVASLLVVHGLHPVSLVERVERALEQVRPLLDRHGGNVELVHVDAEASVVHLRLLGSCDGCPSSAVTLQGAVERAINEAAPEVVRIEVVVPASSAARVPVVLGAKPEFAQCPAGAVAT
jgi:Fe-S cluster biogenesis protein NfuA